MVKDAPNLDAMDVDELKEFFEQHKDGRNYHWLFGPDEPGAEQAERLLAEYAYDIRLAKLDRADGNIRRALQQEGYAEQTYQQLPAYARW